MGQQVKGGGLLLMLVLSTACGESEIVVPELLTIVAVHPHHGAVNVSTNVEAIVHFSHAPAADTNNQQVYLDCVGKAPCGSSTEGCDGRPQVLTSVARSVVQVRPAADLKENTCYVVVVSEGVQTTASDVEALRSQVRSTFVTASANP